GDRLGDDSAVGLELPQRVAALRVDRLEPAVHRAVEDDVSGRGERSAVDREALLHRPYFSALAHVPRDELSAMSARAGVVTQCGAEVGRAGDVVRLGAF